MKYGSLTRKSLTIYIYNIKHRHIHTVFRNEHFTKDHLMKILPVRKLNIQQKTTKRIVFSSCRRWKNELVIKSQNWRASQRCYTRHEQLTAEKRPTCTSYIQLDKQEKYKNKDVKPQKLTNYGGNEHRRHKTKKSRNGYNISVVYYEYLEK